MSTTQSATLLTETIDGVTFSYLNKLDFDYLHDEIFKVQVYRFFTRTRAPFIVDCGANIGMSVLYFKKLYPRAKIIAFEPSPEAFKLLELNVRQNYLQDVQLVNAAVAESDGEMEFYINDDDVWWSLSNTGVKNIYGGPAGWKTITVPKVRLSSYIMQPVDLLKIDIEGMEEIVMREIEEKLRLVGEVRLEFHSHVANKENELDRFLSLLSRNGFSYTFEYGRKLRSVHQIKQALQDNEQYLFFIITHRQRFHLWWQARVIPQVSRVQNRIKRVWN